MKVFEFRDRAWFGRTARGAWLAAWLLGAWSVPAIGHAAPAPGKGASAVTRADVPGLAVQVEAGVPDGEKVAGWVQDQGREALGQREPLEAGDVVQVVVDGGPYDYRLTIALSRREQPLDEAPTSIVCECSSDEMLAKVAEGIGAGADRLLELARIEREAAEQERLERAGTGTNDRQGRRMGPLGYAGIAGIVVGAGMVGGGIPLALRPLEIRGEPGSLELRSTRNAGIGLAAAGGAVLATGVALLVVDLVRHRERMTALVPTLGPQHAGVTFMRRF